MRVIYLLLGTMLYAGCGEQSSPNNQSPTPNAAPTEKTPNPPDDSVPNKEPLNDEQPAACPALPQDNAHALTLSANPLTIDFADTADRRLRVISVYATAAGDEVPTFENRFRFSGKAYWMLSLEDPFETWFTLPLVYAALPEHGVDVTARYGGGDPVAALNSATPGSCVKFTVISFEPEEAQSFKTSTIYHQIGGPAKP